MLLYGTGVEFGNKIILHSFRKVKCLQGSSRTLLSDIQCLRNAFIGSQAHQFVCCVAVTILSGVRKCVSKRRWGAEGFIEYFDQERKFSVN